VADVPGMQAHLHPLSSDVPRAVAFHELTAAVPNAVKEAVQVADVPGMQAHLHPLSSDVPRAVAFHGPTAAVPSAVKEAVQVADVPGTQAPLAMTVACARAVKASVPWSKGVRRLGELSATSAEWRPHPNSPPASAHALQVAWSLPPAPCSLASAPALQASVSRASGDAWRWAMDWRSAGSETAHLQLRPCLRI